MISVVNGEFSHNLSPKILFNSDIYLFKKASCRASSSDPQISSGGATGGFFESTNVP